nr:integrase, catalytic region, zinc finger, CCHC-type, peptidase aspartic, catalytic [Tanacetum cinerariifolium]
MLKGKTVLTEAVSLNPIDPELLKVDVAPLVPKLRKNRTAHTDYIRHTQEEAATLREIIERWTFTLARNVCPLTRIATPIIVPPREPILIVNSTDKPAVTLVYTKKLKASNKKVPNKMETNNSRGSSSSNVPSLLLAYKLSKSSSGTWTPIMDYGDYQIGNVTISRVYYVEGLGHNLFSVGLFCDSDLEVAFRQYTCFIRNLDVVDLLTGSRGNNLYTLSLQDMMTSLSICLLSKASKTKSWLWHRRLSHLNFRAINHLARQGLVRRIRIHNRTEFVNQTLRDYYEEVGISHETSIARSPQQNGVVERRNGTLIEAARTMLIYAQAPLFLWAEAVATACFTQNRSIIRL